MKIDLNINYTTRYSALNESARSHGDWRNIVNLWMGALGAYALYAIWKYANGGGRDFYPRPSLLSSITFATPISCAFAMLSAATWKIVTHESMTDSTEGMAFLSGVYAFPTALACFMNLDRWRPNDQTITLQKSVATSICAATAISLIASGTSENSAIGMAGLVAVTTFPASLLFFNYLARNSLETEASVVGKALASSMVTTGYAGFISSVARTPPLSL